MTWRDPIYFSLPLNQYDRQRVVDWVKENLEGHNERGSRRYRWFYHKVRRKANGWGYPKTYTHKTLAGIEIADKEDAIAFKLRWM